MATKKQPKETQPVLEAEELADEGAIDTAEDFSPELVDEAPVDEASKKRVLTVNGKPIPEEVAHLVPYAMTDQGVAERDRGDDGYPRVEFTADAHDKMLTQRMDATEPWESPDPMKDAVEAHREPGKAYKFLSPRTIKRRGMRRYVPVKNKKGDTVKFGNMILGKIPVEARDQRNRHYQEESEQKLRDVHENLIEKQERMIHDSGARGVAPLRMNERVNDRNGSDAVTAERTRGRAA